jgi:hypothetical protein
VKGNKAHTLPISYNLMLFFKYLYLTCRNGEAQRSLDLFEQLKLDDIDLNPTIIGCLTGMFPFIYTVYHVFLNR